MLEGVTIEQLRTLRAVAEAGSFSAAARKLGRVQAAVSQSIDRLEAQLGLRLFDRSGRVPRAHAARRGGRRRRRRKVEERRRGARRAGRQLKRGAETTLRIVVDVMFPTESLVAFAKEFAREHPDVELVLFTEMLSARHRARAREAIDLGHRDRGRRPAAISTAGAIADVRLIPVAAPRAPARPARGARSTRRGSRTPCRSCSASTVRRRRRRATTTASSRRGPGAWSISRRSRRSSRAGSAGGTCPSTSCATISARAARRAPARRLGERGAAPIAGPGVAAQARHGAGRRVGAGAAWRSSAGRRWSRRDPSRRVIAVITRPAVFTAARAITLMAMKTTTSQPAPRRPLSRPRPRRSAASRASTAARPSTGSATASTSRPTSRAPSLPPERVSPFVLMDYGPPKEFAPLARGKRGVGWHPHRGFETVTLAWEGAVAHRDNAGHAGVIGPGDVAVDDRRRAASSTRSTTRRSSPRAGGRMHMMQLWVNLPRKDKTARARLPADHGGRHSAASRCPAAARCASSPASTRARAVRPTPSRRSRCSTCASRRRRAPGRAPARRYNALAVVAKGRVRAGDESGAAPAS